MKRGDIILTAPPSPFNKPRPALVLQEFLFSDLETVTVALITSNLSFSNGFRVAVHPTPENGLRKPSEIMVDHIQTVPLSRVGGLIGSASEEILEQVNAALRVFFALP